jgi:hypothetical protein
VVLVREHPLLLAIVSDRFVKLDMNVEHVCIVVVEDKAVVEQVS